MLCICRRIIFCNQCFLSSFAFGTGFMAVQGAYIDQWAAALVSIVTAGVLANMAAQASRTGAR